MFGFKEKNREEISPVSMVMGKLKNLSEMPDSNWANYSLVLSQIEDCDEGIKNLPPLYKNKITLYWDGGVISNLNAIKKIPNQMISMVWGQYVVVLKTHIVNTINALM